MFQELRIGDPVLGIYTCTHIAVGLLTFLVHQGREYNYNRGALEITNYISSYCGMENMTFYNGFTTIIDYKKEA